MSSFARNLWIAAIFSVCGIIGTTAVFKYYDGLANSRVPEGTKPLAHLDSARNEVQRRAAKKVIWQRIGEDEFLYSGESVRTLPDSEAKIIFDSGAEVDLDADSVVEISDDNGKVNLDFVKGNLFVKGSGQDDSSFALHSGNTSINVKDAEMSLAKTGSNLDAQVLRGTAEVNNGDKKMFLDKDKVGRIGELGMDFTQQFFKIKSPAPNDKVYIRVDSGELVRFQWAPIEADYQVKLLTGSKRDNLVSTTSFVPGNLGEMNFKLKPGQIWWQLVAIDKKDAKKVHSTLVNRLSIVAEMAPRLLSPIKEATVLMTSSSPAFDLRWVNLSKLNRLHLEVSQDPKFSKTVFSEEVEDTGVHSISPSEEGVYYWRISGFRPGSAVNVTSEIQKFSVRTKLELIPPNLKTPLDAAHVPYEEISNGNVFLSWAPVLGISKYKLTLESLGVEGKKTPPPIVRLISDMTQMKLSQISPGEFKWSLVSVDQEGQLSKPSEFRTLTIDDLPKLLWGDGVASQVPTTYFYTTPKPSLAFSWKPNPGVNLKFQEYKITLRKVGGAQEKVVKTRQISQVVEIPEDGPYDVLVESTNEKGATLTRTDSRNYIVKMRPLLRSPHFSERLPATLVAQKSGTFDISWDFVEGSRQYLVEIKNSFGAIKKEKTQRTVASFKGYLPGAYTVRVAAIDEFGRIGEFSEAKNLTVLNQSDVRPPSFKRLNVK